MLHMIPRTLRIKDFRSFRAAQTFTFPREAGLYFMQGVNEVEPRLGSNGSGKSTVWDALFWLWFNRTPRGLRAGDVCNWSATMGTEVQFEFINDEDGGLPEFVKRTWRPNSWTRDDLFGNSEDLTKDEGNSALALLKLDASPFLHSILTAQRAPMFLDLKHDAQAALFSEVMGLDRWLDYSDKASKKASLQDLVSRELQHAIAHRRGRLDALGTTDLRESTAKWEERRRTRLAVLEEEHVEGCKKSKTLKENLARAEANEASERATLAGIPAPDLEAVKVAHDEVVAGASVLAVEKADYLRLHLLLQRLEDDAKCPTCGQALDRAHIRDELRKAESELVKVNANMARTEGRLTGNRAKRDRLQDDADAASARRGQVKDNLEAATYVVTSARRALDLNERALDSIEERSAEVTAETNPYTALQDEQRTKTEDLTRELDDMTAQLDASQQRHSLLSFWVRGFKEVRLQEIAEALTELEVEVNSCVTALGLVDWELNFQVDRETKGGSISRGFNTFVRSPHNSAPVPWEAWCGGESQRLRIAATMGLSDLIRSRTGASFPLEVWDEPSQGLSPEGIQDLLEALAARAHTQQRQIWIVDHKAHDFGGFAGGAVITKTSKGSVIVQT